MRLKTFQAPSMAAAMNLVRNELGEDGGLREGAEHVRILARAPERTMGG